MAAIHGKGSKLFVAQYDFSGSALSMGLHWKRDLVEATNFSSAAHEKGAGQLLATISQRGLLERADGSADYFLHNTLGSFAGKGITVIPGTPAVAGICYNGEILMARAPRSVPIGNMVTVDAEYNIDGWLGRGYVAEYEIAAAVGAQNGTGVDMGAAASAAEMWLVTMHVISCSTGTYTIKIQESSDNGQADTWTDVAGLSLAATAAASWCATKAGARERYLRVVTLQTSGTPTAKFVVAVSKVFLQT